MEKLRVITHPTPYLTRCGESNGYLVINNVKHPWYGLHYDEIDIEVHGGLTFSEKVSELLINRLDKLTTNDLGGWIIGFDTCHYGDSAELWTDEAVRVHAEDYLLKPALRLIEV